jgi:hypothetical protein
LGLKNGGRKIDYKNPEVRQRILVTATHRASKWISLSEAKQMKGQVGGVSINKKPLLTLKPDYILKPLLTDHRGIRELAFYEAIHVSCSSQTGQSYSSFLTGKERQQSVHVGQLFDTLAVALAMLLKDPVVTESEGALDKAWKRVKKEVDALSRLATFTPPYYGLVGQDVDAIPSSLTPYGVTQDAHLLLQDMTSQFSKPCVIDLKMGTHSYEPDAPKEKRNREYSKYPQQSLFGFRIVGMRVYEPRHPKADENGYMFFRKEFGRSLSTREDVLGAFGTFFTAGTEAISRITNNGDENGASENNIRTKTISNLLLQLRSLTRWFDENDLRLTFHASSLLIVYEGDFSETCGNDNGLVSLKMIDFGRVRRRDSGDESSSDSGYRHGLHTLRELLTDLLPVPSDGKQYGYKMKDSLSNGEDSV